MADPRPSEDPVEYAIKLESSRQANEFREMFEEAKYYTAQAKTGNNVYKLETARDIGEDNKRLEFMEDVLNFNIFKRM